MISGSEVAFFSLSAKNLAEIKEDSDKSDKRILKLLERPASLLATILVTNNVINIAIVLLSEKVLRNTLPMKAYESVAQGIQQLIGTWTIDIANWASAMNFIVTVILVTFILVLFGEVAPKIYSNVHSVKMARRMSSALVILTKVFKPITSILEKGSWVLERSIAPSAIVRGQQRAELDKAIELTTNPEDAKSIRQQDILKSLLSFNEVMTKEVMKSRMDVVAVEVDSNYAKLLETVRSSGYSRIPVYKEELDQVIGVLYVKDLLTHLDKQENFEWQKLIHKDVLYIPESKRIRELLTDFQEKRIHLGIVVDEYGGTAGLVTLEDVLEEVIGEIKDEFDITQEVEFEKVADDKFIFEGKTLLKDVCRVIKVDDEMLDEHKGESDSIAGLFLETTGRLPRKFQEVHLEKFSLKAMAVSKRRIQKVMITIKLK